MCKIGQQEIWGDALHTPVTSSLGSPQEADPRVSTCGGMPLWTATGRQGHNTTSSWATYYSPNLFSPPPHLPQPFTTSSSHHIFMKLCTGGVCEEWVAVLGLRWHYGCGNGAAAGIVQLATVGGGWGDESAGGCHIRNCLILPSAA